MNEYHVTIIRGGKEETSLIEADSARLAVEKVLGSLKSFTYSNPRYVGVSLDGTRFRCKLVTPFYSFKDVKEFVKPKRFWSR